MRRKYWWGVAGQRSHVYVEDENRGWAVWRTREDLDALMAALDKRGVRELALHSALEKVQGCALTRSAPVVSRGPRPTA